MRKYRAQAQGPSSRDPLKFGHMLGIPHHDSWPLRVHVLPWGWTVAALHLGVLKA